MANPLKSMGLPPASSDAQGVANTELVLTTSFGVPWRFRVGLVKWDSTPSSVTCKLEIVRGSGVVNTKVIQVDSNTGTETDIVLGSPISGMLLDQGDEARITVPAGGAGNVASAYIYGEPANNV